MGALVRLAGKVRTHAALPLLAKELTETAARRRTYILRSAYAVALYTVFALFLPSEIWAGPNPMFQRNVGGGHMLSTLLCIQVFGVFLFLPALMCGRITQEKERDSLVLLFLTRQGPWSILLQKYLGGLIPMFSFLLLGLPLAGIAYSFGGIDSAEIGRATVGLFLMCLQIGALALLCSAWCRSTAGAFLATYCWVAALYWGAPFVMICLDLWMLHWSDPADLDRYAYALNLPWAIWEPYSLPYSELPIPPEEIWMIAMAPLLFSIPSTLLFLILARWFLVRRAFLPAPNFLPRLFARIDGITKWLSHATRGIVFWHGSSDLPEDEPVFWRETHRRVLGKPNYLIRVLYAVEIPTLFLCTLSTHGTSPNDQFALFSLLLAVLGALATLSIGIYAANSIVSERVDQTLDVLLTTPLSAIDIIRQKERALGRFLIVVAAPLLTILICEATAEARFHSIPTEQWVTYLICGALLLATYLPLITWVSLWLSLRVRTRMQAGVATVGVFTLWTALAPVLFFLAESLHELDRTYMYPWNLVVLLSPVSLGCLNEMGEIQQYFWFLPPWLVILINSFIYAWLAFFIRRQVFADAEKFLRR